MDYEIFDQKKSRIGRPAVTVHPAGRIYFNQEASYWLVENKVQRVLLLWNQNASMIGIKKARRNDARAYNLAYSSKGGGASITAKSFLNWIGFKVDQASITVEVQISDDPLIEFELPEDTWED
jgi:hypothetical protein